MYVHIVSFQVKEGDDLTFIEGQKFEENTEGIPAGLDHFHIFKDLNKEHLYYLIEYWKDKASKDKMEASDKHKKFHELRNSVIDKKIDHHECEKVI